MFYFLKIGLVESGRFHTTVSKLPNFLVSLEPAEDLATAGPHSSLAVVSYSSHPSLDVAETP